MDIFCAQQIVFTMSPVPVRKSETSHKSVGLSVFQSLFLFTSDPTRPIYDRPSRDNIESTKRQKTHQTEAARPK